LLEIGRTLGIPSGHFVEDAYRQLQPGGQLAERMLNAEMDHHLSRVAVGDESLLATALFSNHWLKYKIPDDSTVPGGKWKRSIFDSQGLLWYQFREFILH
jgi:hypothetical protein